MNTKFTPGPWSVWTYGDSAIDIAVGPKAGGVAVAQIVTANGQGINTDAAMEAGAANARLIAAAPDLLGALQTIVANASSVQMDPQWAVQVARNAIAKATKEPSLVEMWNAMSAEDRAMATREIAAGMREGSAA